jgi:hypothetical protein
MRMTSSKMVCRVSSNVYRWKVTLIGSRLWKNDDNQREQLFFSRRQYHIERSPSWQFVIFDVLITKFIFTQHKHVHAHIGTKKRGRRGERDRERRQKSWPTRKEHGWGSEQAIERAYSIQVREEGEDDEHPV